MNRSGFWTKKKVGALVLVSGLALAHAMWDINPQKANAGAAGNKQNQIQSSTKSSDKKMVAYMGPIDQNTADAVDELSKVVGPGFEKDLKQMMNKSLSTYDPESLVWLKTRAVGKYMTDLALSPFNNWKHPSFSQEERNISIDRIEKVRESIYSYVQQYGNGQRYKDQKIKDYTIQEKKFELDLLSIDLKKMNIEEKEDLKVLICAAYYHYINISNSSKNDKLQAEDIYKGAKITGWVNRLFN